MTARGSAAYRVVLRCYPKAFRQQYGQEMTQTFRDRQVHDRESTSRILAREVIDAAIAAPTMRMRTPMTKIVAIAAATTIAIAAVLIVGPPMLAPVIAVVALAGFVALRRTRLSQPLDRSRRWVTWTVAGVLALSPAAAILATSDEELTELLWSLMAASVLTGTVLLVIGLVLAITRPRSAPSPV